ncbi:hypothetical protein O8Q54_002841 [Raoultella ornithinolytica]
MTTHTLKQCRPDHKETEYLWKLFHAAQRNDSRWHGSEIEFIAEELSRTDLDRNQKLFLLRAWQVLIDDKGGFGRFMGAFDTYVYNMQDPNDECVSWKPELSKLLHDGVLLGVVLEAYDEALQGIADLSMENVALALTIEKCREIVGCPAGVDLQDHLRQLAAENVGLKRVPETDSVAMLLALDSFRSESLPDVGLQKAFESLMYHRKPPATDAYLAGIKADATGPLVSALKVIANSEQHNGDTVVCDFDTLISVAACALRDYYAKQLREGASE